MMGVFVLQQMLFDAGNSGNLFSVPEMTGNASSFKVDELGKEGWSKEHREASVMRYKEKRQNRLFSKRIRYEVRKLNAEKRPRMKVPSPSLGFSFFLSSILQRLMIFYFYHELFHAACRNNTVECK